MSGYLARLMARAAPAGAAPAGSAVEVQPPALDEPRRDADPFETTVIDSPEWPSTTPPHAAPAAMPIAKVSVREEGAQRQDTRRATAPPPPLESPAPALPDGRTTPPPRQAPIDAITIAQTLRPAASADPAPAAASQPDPPPEPTPRHVDDGQAIADRFMSSVVPPALLPPPMPRQEHAREVARHISEVRTTEAGAAVRPLVPPTPPSSPEPDPPANTGLVIGSLTVTVVPPTQAAPARPSSPTTDSRVVVVRNPGVAPAGVPSFSRFS